MSFWKLEQIPWGDMDPGKVTPRLLKLAKTASLVEYNSRDYTQYLARVFAGDEVFCKQIQQWGEDERQHGLALKAWAERVDPSFHFDRVLKRFTDAFRIPVDATESVRGSRARELIARCLVETGTTSYYSALSDAADEPVLKQICRWIAADEVRHYNLFYTALQRYLSTERLSRLSRIRVALGRSLEISDEELSYAFAAANLTDEEVLPQNLKRYSREFLSKALGVYQRQHLHKGIQLAFRAAGLSHNSWLTKPVTTSAYHLIQWRARQVEAALR